jgi:histidine phosphotransferase ChpT
MSIAMDIRVVELLCSRICHDLISPVTAINNGVELWNDMGAEVVEDALGLIAHSAEQAKRRLLYLRLAYGAAGADSGLDDAREAAAGLFAGTKIELDWPAGVAGDLPRGGLKLLLNVVMLASESIGQGGRIGVAENGRGVVVTAAGKVATLRDGIEDALAGKLSAADLDPRTAHAAVTRHFSDHFSLPLKVVALAADRIEFRIGSS